MVIRFRLLIAGLLAAYSFLLFHLYELQVTKGEYYLARAQSQYLASRFLNSERGIIYFTDKDNNLFPAALNKNFPIIYAVPKSIEDPQEAANTLSPILEKPAADLEKIFSNTKESYRVLVKKADSETTKKITDANLKGVYVDIEPTRFYPLGNLASHLLGFVGPNKTSPREGGHYGVEEAYDGILSPKGTADPMPETKFEKTEPGSDLTLTIDLNIQTEAEKILTNLVSAYKAESGVIIVADPKTGKILAMASAPNFDLNSYQNYELKTFVNPATQHVYEPGSVFKALTFAAALDAGSITPETTYMDAGRITMNGKTIQNYDYPTKGPHGKTTMAEVIEHSLNLGAVFAQQKLGREPFLKYMKNFGVDEKTGIDLPGEARGNLKQLNPNERDIAFATASYGQGVALTPLELITAMSAIANGGTLMRPYVNSNLEPKAIRRVIGKKAAEEITQIMVSAVDKVNIAKINGFAIAGKTGTAYIPDFKKGGYTTDVVTTYVGFGPASDPRFIILAKLEKPEGAPLAGTSVVPAWRNLAQFVINYYDIAPDRLEKK